MELNKVKTYINFAKKSNNILYGIDDIFKSKKCYLILISDELSLSSKNKLQIYIEKYKIIYKTLSNSQFFEICGKDAVKVLAITDKNLANAIKDILLTIDVSDGGNLE